MEIIQLLRKFKSVWRNYLNAKKYKGIDALKTLLKKHPNLKAVTVEREAVILVLEDDIKFEWNRYEPYGLLLTLDEHYEVLERQIINSILKEGDTVFDIGANFGYFSVLMKKFCPAINLYAFEPIQQTYSALLRNLDYNKLEDVKTYNFGFADENKDVMFHIPDQLGSAWASMGTGVADVYNYKLKQQLAQVCRLDDFVSINKIDSIDFIKCDVEGAECFGVLGSQLIALAKEGEVTQYPEEKMYNYFFVHPSRADILALILKQL
ncbi:MAG: FkbM family methyltransferase [Pedobacter sp.]|nr:MAG: FkbM family methyltransferase [Pedobacter sp.]